MAPETLMMIGRVVFGGFFVIAGVRNFLHFEERRTTAVTNYGWLLPAPVMAMGFAVQLLCGAALIVGAWVAPAVLLLIAFLILATALYHNLFMFSGKEQEPHLYLTLVNITLAAGLLMVMAGDA
jgi:putative oxidoreductase